MSQQLAESEDVSIVYDYEFNLNLREDSTLISPLFIVSKERVLRTLAPLFHREEQCQNPTPTVNSDLWNNQAFKAKKIPVTYSKKTIRNCVLQKSLSHSDVIKQGGTLMKDSTSLSKRSPEDFAVQTYFEALQCISSAGSEGRPDIPGTSTIAYFQIGRKGPIFYVISKRCEDGRLDIDVEAMYPNRMYPKGSSACYQRLY